MIYIVAGFLRSHTTMMMHCLEAGGLRPFWDSERDDWASSNPVEVNPQNQLREITDTTWEDFQANPKKYDGRLLKIITKYGYLRLPKWDYRVLLMVRNPEEIRQSFARVFGKPLTYTGDDGQETPLSDQLYLHVISGVASDLMEQKIPFVSFQSSQVLKNPLKAFECLQDNGWPINAKKAAKVVNAVHQHVVVN